LEDRCTPATIGEIPLSTNLPAPQGIVQGDDGAMWYTDAGSNKIGRITLDSITEYTLPTPNSDPRGIAFGPDGHLWFTEFGTDRIGRITLDGVLSEFQLPVGTGPSEIVWGPDDALWFTESLTDQIGRITQGGVVTHFDVGAGSTPFGITLGPDDRLWFTQFDSNQIGALAADGTLEEFDTGAADQPTGIAVGSDGNLWFGSNLGSLIGQMDTTGALSVFTGFGSQQTKVIDIEPGGDGALWFTQGDEKRIGRIDVSGSVSDEFDTNFGTFGIAMDFDGDLWFTSPNGPSVGRVTTLGEVTEFQLRASGDLSDIDVDLNPNRWFTQPGASKLGRVTAGSNQIVEYYLPVNSDPRGITRGFDGAMWFTEFGTDRIGRITPAGAITEFSAGITPGAAPRDIARGPDGNMWFTEAGTDQIGRITPAGVVTEFALPFGRLPFGITAGPDGAMWFTEFSGDRIGRITTSGAVTEFVVPGVGSGPYDITSGTDGALWFTQYTSSQIGRITTTGTVTEFSTPTPNAGPTGITGFFDGAVWFSETDASQIGRIDRDGNIGEFSTGLTPGSGPLGIAVGGFLAFSAPLVFAGSTGNQIGTLTVSADVSVTKTSAASSVSRGDPVTYTIVVTNAGPDTTDVANVFDAPPAILQNVSWTAVFAGGASGNANGTGTINETVRLPVGGTITYTLTAVVGPITSGALTNTAMVNAGISDPNPANNSASETDAVVDNTVRFLVTGTGFGGAPLVRVFDTTGNLVRQFFAYDPNFTGGVSVATALIDDDNIEDIITGAGFNGGPHVKAFSGADGTEIRSFLAYDANFRGGVFVAGGDTDGDGFDDIVVGPGRTGGPHVKVFSGATGGQTGNLIVYDPNFTGGVFVSAGDIDGDGLSDVVTGAGAGGGPHVKVFRSFAGNFGNELASFLAYNAGFRGGVSVATGDVNGDSFDDVITGAGFGGGPHVRAFDGGVLMVGIVRPVFEFFAYNVNFRGGVFVGSIDLTNDGIAEVITGAGAFGGPHVKVLRSPDASELLSFLAYDPAFIGGVYVG
jgi:uncharacterized repeat protein (TIGR01451 family)